MAHFAIGRLLHEAALNADEDPDRPRFLHAVRLVRRCLSRYAAVPPGSRKPCLRRFCGRSSKAGRLRQGAHQRP